MLDKSLSKQFISQIPPMSTDFKVICENSCLPVSGGQSLWRRRAGRCVICEHLLDERKKFFTFVIRSFKFFATSQAIVPIDREGKSGQRRAMHRLRAGTLTINVSGQTVPQKITSPLTPLRMRRGAKEVKG
jgi:hypothetical protein